MNPTLALETWLKDATQGLGHWAKHRIETEITAHYEKAYQVALGKGHAEEDAKVVALESLGDAEEARARFKKTHLSMREERHLNSYMNMFKYRVAYLSLMAFYLIYFVAYVGLDQPYGLGYPYAMPLMMLCFGVFYRGQYRLFRGHIRNIFGFELMSLLVVVSMLLWPKYTGAYDDPLIMLNIFLALLLMAAHYLVNWRTTLSIMRKMPKHLSEEDVRLLLALNKKGSAG